MRLRIDKIGEREITTKRGSCLVYDVSLSDGHTYDSFVGAWNSAWGPGMEINLEPGQVSRREKNGKVYLTIGPPKSPKNGGNGANGAGGASSGATANAQPAAELAGAHTLQGLAAVVKEVLVHLDDQHDVQFTFKVSLVRKGESA